VVIGSKPNSADDLNGVRHVTSHSFGKTLCNGECHGVYSVPDTMSIMRSVMVCVLCQIL